MNFRHFTARIRRLASNFVRLFPNGLNFKRMLKLYVANYKLFGAKKKPDEHRVIVLYQNGSPFCPGLADRLKAAVTCYIIAQENGYNFYFYHDSGFLMNSYLEPNEVPWLINKNDISLGIGRFKVIWYANKMLKLDSRVSEYHAYQTLDLYPNLSDELKEKYPFSRIFSKLFKESQHLKDILANTFRSTGVVENKYVAVHIRFMDFFEAVEQNPASTPFIKHASEAEQKAMIVSIHATLENIHKQHPDVPIVLFSDSPKFLNTPHADYIHLIPGQVGHIYVYEGNANVTDKAFIDFFVISKAMKIYNIVGPGTLNSGYSELAARIGDKPFERVERVIG